MNSSSSFSSSNSNSNLTVGYPTSAISPIPTDLIISKKRLTLNLKFTDPLGNLVFKVVNDHKNSTSLADIILRDTNGNPLIFINRTHGGWEGFRGENRELMMFKVVKKKSQSHRRRELEVFLIDGGGGGGGDYNNGNDSMISEDLIKARGSQFHRSCTIYRGNSIIAQTSLLYKLGKVIVGRRKFRLTFFPGLVDQPLIVALVVIFLD